MTVVTLDMDKVQSQIHAGYISRQKHPHHDLYIYNYTHKAQWDRVWTEETLACRGLILTGHHHVVANPFPKFFNYEEHPRSDLVFSKPFKVFGKMDGSLGILYPSDPGNGTFEDSANFAIATRGSFVSNQALIGTIILNTTYRDFVPEAGKTYLFEIIYPRNRIVVNYGDVEDLFLLAVRDTATGVELDITQDVYGWPGPVAPVHEIPAWYSEAEKAGQRPKFHKMEWFDQLEVPADGSSEGVVFLFETPTGHTRLKMKTEEYKRLHRIVAGVNNKNIWKMLSVGNAKATEEMIEVLPDEFHDWVRKTVADFQAKFDAIWNAAGDDFLHIKEEMNMPTMTAEAIMTSDVRKEFARRAQQKQYPGMMFSWIDGKDPSEFVCKMLKPTKFESPMDMDSE